MINLEKLVTVYTHIYNFIIMVFSTTQATRLVLAPRLLACEETAKNPNESRRERDHASMRRVSFADRVLIFNPTKILFVIHQLQ